MKIKIYFKNEADAKMVINEAIDIAEVYGFVTLADIYDLVGQNCDYIANTITFDYYQIKEARVSCDHGYNSFCHGKYYIYVSDSYVKPREDNDIVKYCKHDCYITKEFFDGRNKARDEHYLPEIENVIFSGPATIVMWKDGTKTVVKCQEDDEYSMEVGLTMCIAKKALGNKGNFNDILKKWIPEESEESKAFWEEWSKNMLDAFRKIY